MPLATQLPGLASVSFVRGDDWGATCDFDFNATGYIWASEVVSTVTGLVVTTATVTVTNAALGQLAVSLGRAVTAGLAPGTYRIRLVATAPGGTVRRATDGFMEVKA
jgi:hypothetical protein